MKKLKKLINLLHYEINLCIFAKNLMHYDTNFNDS